MRITSKGQVTIPVELRERFGLLPDTDVDFIADRRGVRLVPARPKRGRGRGEEVLRRLRGAGTVRMTTDEILALTRRP
jgi:AbrB family looped-hinge helix DNA binding protein